MQKGLPTEIDQQALLFLIYSSMAGSSKTGNFAHMIGHALGIAERLVREKNSAFQAMLESHSHDNHHQ
jgi:hypothetical protein